MVYLLGVELYERYAHLELYTMGLSFRKMRLLASKAYFQISGDTIV
jgi:hypothetical protein